jgi:hypothetical protein
MTRTQRTDECVYLSDRWPVRSVVGRRRRLEEQLCVIDQVAIVLVSGRGCLDLGEKRTFGGRACSRATAPVRVEPIEGWRLGWAQQLGRIAAKDAHIPRAQELEARLEREPGGQLDRFDLREETCEPACALAAIGARLDGAFDLEALGEFLGDVFRHLTHALTVASFTRGVQLAERRVHDDRTLHDRPG